MFDVTIYQNGRDRSGVVIGQLVMPLESTRRELLAELIRVKVLPEDSSTLNTAISGTIKDCIYFRDRTTWQILVSLRYRDDAVS